MDGETGQGRKTMKGNMAGAVKRLIAMVAVASTLGCSVLVATDPYEAVDGAGRDLAAFSTGIRQAARYWCEWFGDGSECGYLADVERVLDRADEKIAAWNQGVRDHEPELRLLLDWAERAVRGVATGTGGLLTHRDPATLSASSDVP